MAIEKQFRGDLEAVSRGQMLAAGSLHGRSGAFVLQLNGTMTRGAPQLIVSVVPDSGTGQLAGLAGTMAISIAEGRHSYDFEYTLAETP
jgi:hypothetical protein